MIDPKPSHRRYTLRPAVEADRSFVLSLWRESLGSYVAELFGQWDEAMAERGFSAKLNHGLQIVVEDEKSAGVLFLSQEDDWLCVGEIELVSTARNQGLGTQIMRDISAFADDNSLRIELSVLANNPAKLFYERLGYRLTHYKMYRQPEPEFEDVTKPGPSA